MDPGFDDAGIFFSDNLGDNDMIADLNNTRQLFKRKFKQFIRSFYTGNFVYTYRLVNFWLVICERFKLEF